MTRLDKLDVRVGADTPDPRPDLNALQKEVAVTGGIAVSRPVSPPSELTAEEVRATNALFEAMREAGLFGRKRQAVEDAAHHLAAVARAAARAAPQADANLEGYWERAYWEIVPKLQAALDAAPQADAGTLREVIEAARNLLDVTGRSRMTSAARGRMDDALYEYDRALAASSPATAGREE